MKNAKKNLVFHFGVGRQASFLKIGYVKGKHIRYQKKMLLELKGFILLKVFSSDVQSAFPFDISYASL